MKANFTQKRPTNRSKLSENQIEALGIYQNCEYAQTPFNFSPDSIKQLQTQIVDALEKIYLKYVQSFEKRKQERLSSSFTQPQIYKIVIEATYRNELTQKVKQLVHLENLKPIYNIFHQKVYEFTSRLHAELFDIAEYPLEFQLTLIVEALGTIENAAEELQWITQGIFQHKASVTCEYITKLAFFDKVVKPFEHVIHTAPPSSDLERILEFINMLQAAEKKPDSQNQSDSDRVDDVDIDQLVAYIEGGRRSNSKRRRRGRISKASTAQGSPLNRSLEFQMPVRSKNNESLDQFLDREVKEFKQRLKQNWPQFRLKPRISDDWLGRLRNLMKW